MNRTIATSVLVVGSAVATAGGQAIDLSRQVIVDLSHAYGPSTLY
jgi:hypothetical protein